MLTALSVVAGALLVVFTLVDAAGTLVLPRGLTAGWRMTRVFYRITWRPWRAVGRRIDDEAAREHFLSVFAPASLLTLLVVWLVGLVLGWALIYTPFRGDIRGDSGFGSLFYFSGSALIAIGFGDITATSTLLRLLTLVEAVSGLGTIALLISYLPALYSAYSRREAQILTLDHPSGEPIRPASLIRLHAPDGDVGNLYAFFAPWERWVAEVMASHVSYPMLALFRSQQPGQSWITALGVVADAAALACAAIPGADERQPFFTYQRARRALAEIPAHLGMPLIPGPEVSRPYFEHAYAELEGFGLDLVPPEDAWARFRELRAPYGRTLESMVEFLLAPPGFWGHAAGRLEHTTYDRPDATGH